MEPALQCPVEVPVPRTAVGDGKVRMPSDGSLQQDVEQGEGEGEDLPPPEPEEALPSDEELGSERNGDDGEESETQDTKEPPPFHKLVRLDPDDAENKVIRNLADQHLCQMLEEEGIRDTHTVVVIYDNKGLTRSNANRVYSGLSDAPDDKPILLIIQSPGGDVATAYFISKLCREHTKKQFEVVVPRQAKSAATMICCGADRIHMGSLSELGPIDPQVAGVPALALKNSVEHMAELVSQYPRSAEMFSDYLAKSLRVDSLGHYERVAESAAQYANRLLGSRNLNTSQEAVDEIARRLVYAYKDHGFAIDAGEAIDIFGEDVVEVDTPEYRAGDVAYRAMDFISWFVENRFGTETYFTGAPEDACVTVSTN